MHVRCEESQGNGSYSAEQLDGFGSYAAFAAKDACELAGSAPGAKGRWLLERIPGAPCSCRLDGVGARGTACAVAWRGEAFHGGEAVARM